MFQLPFATSQAAANLAQRMRPPQLAKQHGHKLAPTGETPRVPLCLVLLDCFLEISARKQFQHLRENAAYFVHRCKGLKITRTIRSGKSPGVVLGVRTWNHRPEIRSLSALAGSSRPSFKLNGEVGWRR